MRRRVTSGSGYSVGKDLTVGTAHVTRPQFQTGGQYRVRARSGAGYEVSISGYEEASTKTTLCFE